MTRCLAAEYTLISCTPAMEAGITKHIRNMEDVLTGMKSTKCYCDKPTNDIYKDLLAHKIPNDPLMKVCCWKRI